MNYLIASGWWCASREEDTRAELIGSDEIRKNNFHQLWYQCINEYTNPKKILIVDSNSPIKPSINKNDERIEFVSININAGHSTNHIGRHCGVSRAFILSFEYALQCDVDYYVYVEQDGLIYGKGIVEYCIQKMHKDYMFGSGEGTPQKIQQSFFIIKKESLLKFMNRYRNIPFTDNEISPEEKFHIAACRGPVWSLSSIYKKSLSSSFFNRIYRYIDKYLKEYQVLPIGYGRKRPVNFTDKHFYFQHGSQLELEKFKKILEEGT